MERVVYIERIGVLKRVNCELGRGKGFGIDQRAQGRGKDFENLKRIQEFEKAFKVEKPYVQEDEKGFGTCGQWENMGVCELGL